MASQAPVLIGKVGSAVSIILNRPKALNALSLEMCREIRGLYQQWRVTAPASAAVIVKGAGGKAFCAGGDVKSIYTEINSRSQDSSLGRGERGLLSGDFFRDEYEMNYLMGTSKIPQVSIWDGIVMGGGVGVSVLGKFRVATEKSMFAMPETAIGLFPDVGSSFWLPHLKSGFGLYIGLTGSRLNAADLLHSGIATHYVKSENIERLEAALGELSAAGDEASKTAAVRAVLDDFTASAGAPDQAKSVLIPRERIISDVFERAASIEEVLHTLKSSSDPWAADTAAVLVKMSPTSLKLTLEQVKRGKLLGGKLDQCLQMEYRMVQGCMRTPDFAEGVRALLVDRDNSPQWSPSSIEAVTPALVESFFDPLGANELALTQYQ